MKKYGKQFLLVLAVSAALRGGSAAGSLERALKRDWGLEIPGGYTVEYRAATAADPEKGGLRFHVLLYQDADALDGLAPWAESAASAGHAGSGAQAAAEILTALGVPGGEWPQLESAGMWRAGREDGRELFLFHSQGDIRLYILESIP